MSSLALSSARSSGEGAAAPPPTSAVEADRLRRMVDEDFDFIWRLLRRLGLRDDHAEDATQQVFFIASTKLASIELGSERSYLFGTALRVAADARRSAAYRREVAHADPAAHLESNDRPDEMLDRREARAMLDHILDAMDLELRTVFVLYELEELTTPEIAKLLSLPIGTAASRLRRGREQFEMQLQKVRREQGVSR